MGKDLGVSAKFGLDGSGFQEGIGKINSQLKVVQAQFKEASSRVSSFGNSSEGLKLKAKSLNEQIELQKMAVEKLELAYQKSVEAKGEDAKATQNLQIKLLNAKTALNNMDSELKKTNEEVGKQTSSWSKFGSQTKEVSEKAQGHIMGIKNAFLGITAAAAGGFGLFKFAEGAIQAGDASYQLSQKLHVSAQEASAVNKMLKVTDTDSSAFISTLTKLDKGVESAGKNGNATTKALSEFGVSLTDAHGKLLPMPEQMQRLSDAYKKASEAGNEEAFTAQVLGNKGQALIPLLEDYTSAKEAAAQVKGIGVDPKQAHDTEVALTALKMQVGQLSGVFAKALIPVVQQAIPPLMEGFTKLTEIMKNHKAEIDKAVKSFIDLAKGIGQDVMPIIKTAFIFMTEHGTLVKNSILGIGIAFTSLKAVINVVDSITKAQKLWGVITAENSIAVKALNFITNTWKKITAETSVVMRVLNAVMEANPIGLVIVAITALAGVLVYLWNTNEGFRKVVIETWNKIKETAIAVFNGIGSHLSKVWESITTSTSNAWNGIKEFFTNSWNNIKNTTFNVLNNIKNFFTTTWSNIKETTVNFVSNIITSFVNKFSWLINGATTVFNGLKMIFAGEWEVIKNVFLGAVLLIIDLVTGNFGQLSKDASSIINNLKNAMSNIWEGIKLVFTGYLEIIHGYVTTVFNAIVTIGKTIFNDLKQFFVNLWSDIKNTAINAWDSLINTGKNVFNDLKNFFYNLWNGIKNTAVDVWNGLKSFFTEFWEAEKRGWTLILNTIKDIVVGAFNAIVDFIRNFPSKFENFTSNVGTAIKNGFNSAVSFLKSLPSEALTWGKDFIEGLVSGIKSKIGSVVDAVSGIGDKIRSFLHFSVPDEGPLTDYETWMPDFMEGLSKGIERSKHMVTNSIKGLSTDIKVNTTSSLENPKVAATTQSKKVEQHLYITNLNIQSEGDKNSTLQQLQFMAPI